MESDTTLTVTDIAAACQCADNTVRGWLRDGMPHTKSNGGRGKTVQIDRATATQWLIGKGKIEYAARLNPTSTDGADVELPDQPASSSVGAMRQMGQFINRWALYYQAVALKQEEDGNVLGTHQYVDLVKDLSEQYRKIVKDLAGIELSQGEVVPRSEVEQDAARCGTAIRNDLLALPGKLSGQLVGKSAAEISVLLKDSIVDCLRHLSKMED